MGFKNLFTSNKSSEDSCCGIEIVPADEAEAQGSCCGGDNTSAEDKKEESSQGCCCSHSEDKEQ